MACSTSVGKGNATGIGSASVGCAGYPAILSPYAGSGSYQSSDPKPRKPVIDEHDPRNIKLAHRVPSTASDEELLFLQQIGLRWARVELQAAESDHAALSKVQKRFQ